MHVQWVRVEETIGGTDLSEPNRLLHAKGGVSDDHKGNLRWINAQDELRHCEDAFVSVKPNTRT